MTIEKERLQFLIPKYLAEKAKKDAASQYLKISAWGEKILIDYFQEIEKKEGRNKKIIDLNI